MLGKKQKLTASKNLERHKLIGGIMGIISMLATLLGCAKSENPKVQTIDPSQLLYSTPTLCDALPPADDTNPASQDDTYMHEDDWRQIEFIDKRYHTEAKQKISEYMTFRNSHKKGIGFTGVYIRKETYPSLESLSIKTSDISDRLLNLTISGYRVLGGFSMPDVSGAYLYGAMNSNGSIIYLGIAPLSNGAISDSFKTAVASLASKYGLILVDWYKGIIIENMSTENLQEWARLYEREKKK